MRRASLLAAIIVVASSVSGLAASPFDGRWNVVVSCGAAPDGAKGYRWQFPATVKDGVLRGQFRTPGASPSGTLSGRVDASGDALLTMTGRTGDPDYAIARVAGGSPIHYTVRAHLAANSGSGERQEARSCQIGFSR